MLSTNLIFIFYRIKIFKLIITYLLLLVMSSFWVGCLKEDRSNCEDMMRFEIIPQWPNPNQIPKGIRILIYPINDKSYVVDNLSSSGGVIYIGAGTYALSIYNNDATNISFRNVKKYETYEAFTKELEVESYKLPVDDENLVDQPDSFWTTSIDRHDIYASHTLTIYPEQVVKTYIFTLINIEGFENIRAARGSISGMRGSFFMNQHTSPKQASTLFFDKITPSGKTISTTVKSFGVITELEINGEIKKRKHVLTIEFMNRSEVCRYNIDVTDRLDAIEQGGEIIIQELIVVPPGEDSGDGGFDAEIGDWEEIIVPLG